MKRNPWPYAIVGYFVLFITGVVTWVVYATHHQDQLIRPDYYEHEIRYQQHIDTVARTAAIRSGVQIHYDLGNQTVSLSLPASAGQMIGTIQLYRPSDSKLDKTFPLTLDKYSSQTFSVIGMESGLWKLHLAWSADGADYYFYQPLVLAGK